MFKYHIAKAIFFFILLIITVSLDARPQYLKVFKEVVQELPEGSFAGPNCVSCHIDGEPRTNRSEFMNNLSSFLAEDNLKDPELILEALLGAIEEPSLISGKTYRDLLLEGLAPTTKP